MRELIVDTFVTLDGVMQAPGGPQEDPTGGFSHGGWSFGYWDEAMQASQREGSGPSDLLLGRKTYEIFAAFWPHQTDDPVAAPLNAATKYVASRTLSGELSWQNSRLIEGDVVTAVRALKAQNGPPLRVVGSADLLQTLIANRLVDEYRVWIFPLVLGTGKRLFGAGTVPDGLELTRSQTSSTGVIMTAYRAGAEIKRGSFVPEEVSDEEHARRAALDG